MLTQTNHIPQARVDEVPEMTGLPPSAATGPGHFPCGRTQGLGMAAALLGDPQVLLFDEPVNGLNPDGVRWVRNLLKGLAREGRTVFVSSHLMSEMALTANEVIIIGACRRPLSRQIRPSALPAAPAQHGDKHSFPLEVFAPWRARNE